jgi:ABC-type transporter Mla maintaining outer membrane lipid asymmetry permease subunit MlaE
MRESGKLSSNVAAAILALVCLSYIFAPTGVFIGALIVVPIVGLSLFAWWTYTFKERRD